MPAIPPCIQEPLWDQVTALLPPRQVHHLLGCHRQRIPDCVVFDKLIQILVFGCGYRRNADHTCSATTLRCRRDEWIALGVADQLHRLTLAAYDRLHCLDLEHLAVDGCITRRCGGQVAGPRTVTLRRGPDRWWPRVACPVLGQARTSSLWGRVGRAGTLGLVADRPATLAVGMDAPALDGWTLLGYPAGPPPRADT